MMDAGKRRAYLSAMGIQGWVRREGEAEQAAAVDETAAPPGNTEPSLQGEAQSAAASPVPDSVAAVALDLRQDRPSPPGAADPRLAQAVVPAGHDWAGLEAAVAACTACDLHRDRTQTVFGIGDRQAALMIVGEAPGAEEDRLGEPFVGRAGQLLDQMLRAIELERRRVYITNVVKCRPPNNRNPHADEIASCIGYLQRQITLVAPRVILVLGRIAANSLLGTDATLASLRGRAHQRDGVPVVVTYHPAYLLRTPRDKAKSWADLRRVQRLLQEAPA